ncbi:MAG: hypothetical protein OSB73_16405, partial [Candidatus Latescibacteria bacterium]|nr:hypothetical protein [Candidatus Latescibacterota bacterium]
MILNDLQSKIASVKKDRKLFFSKVDAEDAAPQAKSNNKNKTQRIVDLPLEARFERIFGDRFVAPARLEALLGVRFSPKFNPTVQEGLNKAWTGCTIAKSFRPILKTIALKPYRTLLPTTLYFCTTPTLATRTECKYNVHSQLCVIGLTLSSLEGLI